VWKKHAAIAGLAVSALFLSACGGPGAAEADERTVNAADEAAQELIDAAKEEGSVVWYSSIPEAPTEAAASAFEEKYGVTVEIVRAGSEILAQRYGTERDTGDVVGDVLTFPEDYIFSDYIEKSWLAPFDKEKMPALNQWPSDQLYENSYALVNIQPIGVAYNTDLVNGEDLKDWESILDEQYKGKIVLADPGAIVPWTELLRLLNETYGADYLTSFKEQNFQMQPSAVPGTQQVAAGESALAFPSLYSVVNPLKEQGAPIDIKFFEPTTGVQQFTAISEGSDHPNASALLVNYLLSAEGQSVLNEGVAASVLEDVAGTVPLPEGYRMPDLLKALDEQKSLLALLGL
jgi:iron(III) transport system substrate-binding protein